MFWICEVLGGQMLTGHADHCPYLMRRKKRSVHPPCSGPFESKKLAVAAAKLSPVPFRWCKSCEQSRDLPTLSELNAQLDRTRADYKTALTAAPDQTRLKSASDALDQALRAFRLFVRKNRGGRS